MLSKLFTVALTTLVCFFLLALNNQVYAAQMVFSPSSGTFNIAQTYDIDLVVYPEGTPNGVSGVQATIQYDPTMFSVTYTNGSTFNFMGIGTVNSGGIISRLYATSTPFTGTSATVITFHVTPLQNGVSPLTILTTDGVAPDSTPYFHASLATTDGSGFAVDLPFTPQNGNYTLGTGGTTVPPTTTVPVTTTIPPTTTVPATTGVGTTTPAGTTLTATTTISTLPRTANLESGMNKVFFGLFLLLSGVTIFVSGFYKQIGQIFAIKRRG